MKYLLGKAIMYFMLGRMIGSYWPCDVLGFADRRS